MHNLLLKNKKGGDVGTWSKNGVSKISECL